MQNLRLSIRAIELTKCRWDSAVCTHLRHPTEVKLPDITVGVDDGISKFEHTSA